VVWSVRDYSLSLSLHKDRVRSHALSQARHGLNPGGIFMAPLQPAYRRFGEFVHYKMRRLSAEYSELLGSDHPVQENQAPASGA
jgi:hypothetical protein